jgi:hypothetical protein
VKGFARGLIAGAVSILVLVVGMYVFRALHERDRKIFAEMEARRELQETREALTNRAADEFLADPAIRGAADRAAAEFQRKRDEAIRAIRGSGRAD